MKESGWVSAQWPTKPLASASKLPGSPHASRTCGRADRLSRPHSEPQELGSPVLRPLDLFPVRILCWGGGSRGLSDPRSPHQYIGAVSFTRLCGHQARL